MVKHSLCVWGSWVQFQAESKQKISTLFSDASQLHIWRVVQHKISWPIARIIIQHGISCECATKWLKMQVEPLLWSNFTKCQFQAFKILIIKELLGKVKMKLKRFMPQQYSWGEHWFIRPWITKINGLFVCVSLYTAQWLENINKFLMRNVVKILTKEHLCV